MNKQPTLRKSALVGYAAMALSMFSNSAQAVPMVMNGSFETTIGRLGNTTDTGNPTAGMLNTSANITGPATTLLTLPDWKTTQDGIGCVVFPNTALTQVCGPHRFPNNRFWADPGLSMNGGNYVLIDGDRDVPVSTTLYQTLTGLVVGQFYDVMFEQAAAQFTDRTGDTTERWDVSLGGDPLNISPDGNFIDGVHQLSALMDTPSQGFHPWMSQTLRFKATKTSEILGFFSVGAPGGLPPVVLLDGITIASVPEPETLSLLGIGLLGILAARRQNLWRS